MQKFAVIDVGSNSVRLMLVADGKVLYKTLATTRLGEGLTQQPVLRPEAILRSAIAVRDFYNQAKREGAEAVYAFATAAVRSAENGREFVDKVRELCPLEVEVVSGETEAELGILGALGFSDGAVLDVGGASTEIVVRKSGEIIYKKSVNIGAVRLKELCGLDKKSLESVGDYAARAFGSVPNLPLYAIGGTATTLAALVLGLQEYDREKVTGCVITQEKLAETAEWLLHTPIETIANMPCIPNGRADILAGGAVYTASLMKNLGFNALTVSDRDNLEGYAIKKGLME